MCGIVGILGQGDVAPRLMESLQRLEYRGYDSAGIATLREGHLSRRRAVGKIAALREVLDATPIDGTSGIAHTRWATHGAPTELNAHPHTVGRVAVVHNGIIENYARLREALKAEGVAFTSETDTEVIAQLCNRFLDEGMSPKAAVEETLRRIDGAFALCFLFEGHDDLMIAARQGSPLVVGYGQGEMEGRENYVGSDALALASLSQRIAYLEEGDMAVVTRGAVQIYDRHFAPVSREVREVRLDAVVAEKGNHRHFMHKEMHEQPESLMRALSGALDLGQGRIGGAVAQVDFSGIDRVVMVACGTAHYATALAKYWFESFAGLPVEIDIASEFRYRDAPLTGRELAVFVSQSGETADTLAALRHVRGRAAATLAVVNVPSSSIAREADAILEIQAGPEIGVASTKAFTGQIALLACLALAAGRQTGRLAAEEEARQVQALAALPRQLGEVLALEEAIERIAATMTGARDALFLGRGPLAPVAFEAALKLKEISYIHAEGYAAGELKHGPIALVDRQVPVVVFAASGPVLDKTLSNVQEVVARGGRVILVTDARGAAEAGDDPEQVITLPETPAALAPFLHAVVAQLLAYHVAVLRGTDVDQPRNLAKSVTVE